MKKNIAMRLASGLMLSCLLSTCVISGTFAKYTTEATGTDTARVAKFGVEITANGATFAKEYDGSVEANGEYNVVAPGTSGEMVAMTIAGTPEVDVNVAYEATLTLEGWTVNAEEYCPIVITVNSEDFYIGGEDLEGNDITTIANLKAAVEDAIEAYSNNYEANQDLSLEATVATPDVSWEWAFEGDDVKDTALGKAAADGNAATISLTVKTTVTQID